jgi:hypothetical protein
MMMAVMAVRETGDDQGGRYLAQTPRAESPDVLELIPFEEPEDIPNGLGLTVGTAQGVVRTGRQPQT